MEASALGLLAAAGLITQARHAPEWNKAAFDAKTVEETLKALGAGTPAQLGQRPDHPRHRRKRRRGAGGCGCPQLAGVEAIAILIEEPQPLAASFVLPAGTEAHGEPRSRWARPPTSMRWSGRRPVPDGQKEIKGHPRRLRLT